MNEGSVVDLAVATIWLIIKVSAPVLLVSLIVGLIVSIFQTVTSIQEQTLTFLPKFFAILLVIALTGSWIMNSIVSFMVELCNNFSTYIAP